MKNYNGYTPTERTKAGSYQRKLLAEGKFVNPDSCDICNLSHAVTGKKIDRHNENYTDLMAFYPLCQACHQRLHRRFENWEAWKQVAIKGYGNLSTGGNVEPDLSAYGNRWFHYLKSYEEPQKRKEYEATAGIAVTKQVITEPIRIADRQTITKRSSPSSEPTNKGSGWATFLTIANEALQNRTALKGGDGKLYKIEEAHPLKIIFNCNGKSISQGKAGFEFFMNRFKEYQSAYPVKAYKGDKDKMYFIVAFHPSLHPSDDGSHILKV